MQDGSGGNPIGFLVSGDHVAIFSAGHPAEAIEGLSLWGRPGYADIDLIAATLRGDRALLTRPRVLLVDLRRLDCIDLRVFSRLPSALAPRCGPSHQLADRLVLIRSEGADGWIAAELFVAMSPGSPARSFVDTGEALDWIGISDAALLDDLDRIGGVAPGHRPLIGSLREVLDRLPSISVRDAAREIGVSQRTLQRRLCETGTTFQQEANRGRLRIAQRLMCATDTPLKCIALEAGYVSAQHFSSAFHRQTGMSPGRWRATHALRAYATEGRTT